MKKTKGTIAVLIILAILVLGIGYAAMTANLQVSGSASANVDDANFKVVYTKVEKGTPTVASKTVTPTLDAKVDAQDATKATISVSGFTSVGDTVTFTYTIANQSEDLNATLGTPTVTNSNEAYFEVTSKTQATSLVAKTGTTTQTVTVKCIKTPTDTTQTANITVALTASLAE